MACLVLLEANLAGWLGWGTASSEASEFCVRVDRDGIKQKELGTHVSDHSEMDEPIHLHSSVHMRNGMYPKYVRVSGVVSTELRSRAKHVPLDAVSDGCAVLTLALKKRRKITLHVFFAPLRVGRPRPRHGESTEFAREQSKEKVLELSTSGQAEGQMLCLETVTGSIRGSIASTVR